MVAFRGASRRGVLAGLAGTAGLVLAGCGGEKPAEPAAKSDGPEEGSLEWAVYGPWRSSSDRGRDAFRHPIETLQFFGLSEGQTVVELWPGAGYWTDILAPYLKRNRGTYVPALFEIGENADPSAAQIVQRFEEKLKSAPDLYGSPKPSRFGATSGDLADKGSADLVMFMRNLHNWMAAGIAEKAFADAFAALKPGGILGIEQHRGDIGDNQDPAAADGYVQEPFVKQLAAEAGFALVASSEINANPNDTKDHPFGVWTLPPQRLSAPRGEPANPNFDHSKYDLIGESDRMTLKFRKPA